LPAAWTIQQPLRGRATAEFFGGPRGPN